MEGLFSLSFGERFADLGIFVMYGLVFMLAGGAAMTLLDAWPVSALTPK